MAYESIFASPLGQAVLAFILLFTVVFAVLQKAEILGKGKRQIDALVSLAVALIVISVGSAMDFIQKIIPFMAIVLVIILVFMILTGMLFKQGEFDLHKNVKIGLGILIFIAIAIAVLMFTGGWAFIVDWFSNGGTIASNIILIVVVVAAIAIAYFATGKGDSGKSDKKE